MAEPNINIRDIIFGDLINPDHRVKQTIADLSGIKHLSRVDPPRPIPDRSTSIIVTTSGPIPYDKVRCWYMVDDMSPTSSDASVMDLSMGKVHWDTLAWDYVRFWQGELPPQPRGALARYSIGARIKGTDQWVFADNQSHQPEQATKFVIWFDLDQIPSWARDSRIYHVFLDRFFPGEGREWEQPEDLSGFFGGTLRGVIQNLDYIQDLGLNAIWLSPVFASPTHHGYDATDYYMVEPRLGTNEDLLELIAEAHKREIRIILDFVANHWSNLHPTFQAAQKDKNGEFINWYTWKKWPDEYKTYFDVKSMPELNLEPGSPARTYLLECVQYWLRQGVDGYRLDYAYGPPYDFWVDFRKACRKVNPDCFLFGEIVHTASKQKSYAGVFDGIIDFHLVRALRETFALGNWSIVEFEAFLSAHETYFGDTLLRVSILDNHDMNRFLFLAGNDTARLKMAALVIMTLSQPVILYYGTEVGVTQERPIHQKDRGAFEEARLPMKWGDDQDRDLHSFLRKLIHLRQYNPSLLHGERSVVHMDSLSGTYAYLRESENSQILVILNTSLEPRSIKVNCALPDGVQDRLNNYPVTVREGVVEIQLPPKSGAFVQ